MLGALLGDLDGPFQIMNRWKTYLLNDLDIAYFNKTIETVREIQPADLQALANQYLQAEDFYELVVY
jgi:predicted Zn-dependent peptidase